MQTENPAGDICHHAAGRCSVRRVNKLCEDALQRQMKTLPSFLPAHGLRGCFPTTSKSCYGLASFPISRKAAESSCARSAGLKTKKQCKGASWRFWPLLGFNARVSLEEWLRQAGCVFFYSPEISHALAAFLQALAQPLRSVWCSRHAGLFACLSSSAGCPRAREPVYLFVSSKVTKASPSFRLSPAVGRGNLPKWKKMAVLCGPDPTAGGSSGGQRRFMKKCTRQFAPCF